MAKKQYQTPLLNLVGSIDSLTRSLSPLRRLSPVAQSSLPVSDRNAKEEFGSVDPTLILDRLVEIPITTWNYKKDSKDVRHIGPMAQDFAAAFGVGADDRHINTTDANGVALASIQALYRMIQERDTQIAELRAEIQALKDAKKP